MENTSETNALDDFFSMLDFDCMIRPQSSFSQAAQWLSDFQIVVYPKHSSWIIREEKRSFLVIDETVMEVRDS